MGEESSVPFAISGEQRHLRAPQQPETLAWTKQLGVQGKELLVDGWWAAIGGF